MLSAQPSLAFLIWRSLFTLIHLALYSDGGVFGFARNNIRDNFFEIGDMLLSNNQDKIYDKNKLIVH